MKHAFPVSEVYQSLVEALGPQDWWPGDTAVEIMVGAVLVQHAAWGNVEKAVDRLKQARALSWKRLHRAEPEEVAEWIRPAGTFRVKARRLKALAAFMVEHFAGDEQALFALPVAESRARLLDVPGIGPETADCILLYAGGKPVFVIDAYTRRVLSRHRWALENEGYDRLAARFTTALPPDASLYNEYHALWVRVGKTWCRKTPQCASCPLEKYGSYEHPTP